MAETFNDVVSKTAESIPRLSKIERLKSLDPAILLLEKAYGQGTIMRMDSNRIDFPHIETDILSLDIASGIGGLPRGRIIEIYGNESSGKTSLVLNLIAQAQKNDGICAFVDVEHALDPVWARKLGVNVDELLVSQPDGAEQALEIVDAFVKSGGLDIVVVDSVAALVPRAEAEGDMGDAHMAILARLMGQALRKLTAAVQKTNTTLVFINQTRSNIGGYGSPVTTSGGKALKFFASQRIEVAKIESLKKGDNQIGNRVRAKFVKNKVSPPFKIAEFDLMFDGYFNKEGSIIEEAEKLKIIKKSGSWYSYNDNRLGQGLDKSSQLLMDNRELCEEIKQKVIQYHREISIEKMTNSSEEGRQRRRAGQSVDQASQVEDSDVETHSSEEE
jgi:recombination protein RecA